MVLPTLFAQASGVVLTSDLQVSWPLLVVFGVVIIGWGEARVHISGLREWKKEAAAEIAALKKETGVLNGRADLQGQQMTHILNLLEELRADVKRLLRQGSE